MATPSSPPPPSSTIKLQSSDGDTFEVETDIIQQSGVIKTILNDLSDNTYDETIPLPNVNSVILKRIIEWCSYHHNNNDDNIIRGNSVLSFSKWEFDFFEQDKGLWLPIILAADYLNIKGLVDKGSKMFANIIKGMTVEEIREVFHIPNDLTPEEEEEIIKETEWCKFVDTGTNNY